MAVSQMGLCVFDGVGGGGSDISKRHKNEGQMCTSSEFHKTVVKGCRSFKCALYPERISVFLPLPKPPQVPCPGLLTHVVAN